MAPKKASKIRLGDDEMEGDGMFDINLGNLPEKVARLYKQKKDDEIKSIKIFRRPLEKELIGALDLFTGNSASNFLKKTPYDKLFHLGLLINDKLLFHKQENFSLERIPSGFKKTKGIEYSPVSDFGDITIKTLFRRTRDKMGDKKFYGYDALKNNCQDFILAALDSVGAKYDKEFVKQDLEELANDIPEWKQKIGVALTDVARGAKKVIGGGRKPVRNRHGPIEKPAIHYAIRRPKEDGECCPMEGRSVNIMM